MKSSILEQNLHATNAHAPLDRRYAERVPIHYRVIYTGTEGARLIKTKGSLIDLSKTGCKILGTMLPAAGGCLTITLYLEDGRPPLCLTDATRDGAIHACHDELVPGLGCVCEGPVEEPAVEVAGRIGVAGANLEVHDGIAHGSPLSHEGSCW